MVTTPYITTELLFDMASTFSLENYSQFIMTLDMVGVSETELNKVLKANGFKIDSGELLNQKEIIDKIKLECEMSLGSGKGSVVDARVYLKVLAYEGVTEVDVYRQVFKSIKYRLKTDLNEITTKEVEQMLSKMYDLRSKSRTIEVK